MENKKIISKSREKKQEIVLSLSEKIDKAKALVLTNYQGLTHKQLEGIKKTLKQLDADFIITKNTLLKIALENSKFKIQDDLSNPTAALIVYEDVVAPLKEIAKSLKLLGLPTIKLGILDNQTLTSDQVLKLASLPSREVLLAQVVGGLKSPIFGLHRALSWNISSLVMTLSAIQQKKN